MFKRLFCLLLALGLCLGAGAMAEEKSSYVMAGFDDTQYRDWASNLFFQRMEEKTGISFTFQQYDDLDKWTAAKAAMQAGEEMPDVLFKAALSSAECMELLDRGVLIDLAPYLESCCPNLWALLQVHPEYLEAITLPDGRIAALPYINPTPTQNYLWINQKWLKNLGLSMPQNAQELVCVLEAFRDRDPNKNGKKDEIPLGFLGAFDLKFLAHAFGLIANDYNIFAQDGQVKFMPLEENFRLFITWCRDLYAQGLLDSNGFTISSSMRQVTDTNATATYGAIITPMAANIFQVSWATDYVIVNPLEFEGQRVYRDFSGPVTSGTFAVTSRCADPEALLRWADTLYTEEGGKLASVGKENVDYFVDGDGTWRLSDTVQKDNFFTINTLIDGGASAPGQLPDAFQRKFSGSAALQATLQMQEEANALSRRPFPYYHLTRAQEEQITPLQNKIGYYVDMQIARWVLGEEEISDASFAAFESTLDEMGLPAFLAFWQEVLESL